MGLTVGVAARGSATAADGDDPCVLALIDVLECVGIGLPQVHERRDLLETGLRPPGV
jgi:hypothetical protein